MCPVVLPLIVPPPGVLATLSSSDALIGQTSICYQYDLSYTTRSARVVAALRGVGGVSHWTGWNHGSGGGNRRGLAHG